MKWWCSFLHGLDWLRHDSAKPQAADLHAPFALVDFRRNAMGMKIFLRIWFQNINKGKTVAQCLRERTDYAQNPEKTAKGQGIVGGVCPCSGAKKEPVRTVQAR
mgnify:CR=1 FL=1